MSSNNEIVAVLRQALEALEVANSCIDGYYLPKEKAWLPEIEQAITSLRQAIARAEGTLEAEKHEVSQEPVAWGNFKKDGTLVGLSQHPEDQTNWTNRKPLYTHPYIGQPRSNHD